MAGGAGPLVFLLFYHWVCFGSPFSTGFHHQIYFDYNKDMANAFSTPLTVGVPGLLGSIRYQGLFYASPVALFALAGWPAIRRRRRGFAWLMISIFAAMLLFYGKYRVWWGATSDTRYLVPVIALLFLGLPTAIDRFREKPMSELARAALVVLFAFALVRSVFWSFLSVASFYHRPFETPDLVQMVLLNNPTAVLMAVRRAFPSHVWAGPAATAAAIPVLAYAIVIALRAWKRRAP
ncbi:MAG: hypothetical protein M5R36_04470 [Deltaproteobacteria bacterium]|nr:hypothetical protein [Deltaproteobacteria bacterium]